MSTVTISDTPFVGNDRLLVGIVLSVLTFWLFAQSVINVVPAMSCPRYRWICAISSSSRKNACCSGVWSRRSIIRSRRRSCWD